MANFAHHRNNMRLVDKKNITVLISNTKKKTGGFKDKIKEYIKE